MMTMVRVLKLSLHGQVVGYLAGFNHGKNVLTFSQEFVLNKQRPTFSLITRQDFPNADKLLSEQWTHRQRLNPILSNLLPEGALRSLIVQALKIHIDNEFELMTYLGQDLPGALIAESVEPQDVPSYIFGNADPISPKILSPKILANQFSLAGVQMKFSMKQYGERFTLPNVGKLTELGDWIIKTPSIAHQGVPQNEYSMMTLAQLAGVEIPEIQLVRVNQLDNLPSLHLPNEDYAYAIKRFDRLTTEAQQTQRIHSEDFAQILNKYPQHKYDSGNYTQIGKILYHYSQDGLADARQLARRLLVNILLGNGDAHLKNWSVIYPDTYHLRLSPAYDIVFTKAYINNEQSLALNLAKIKNWYQMDLSHFEAWAKKADIPWRAVKLELDSVLEIARTQWRQELEQLPMLDVQKQLLQEHWQLLHTDFRI